MTKLVDDQQIEVHCPECDLPIQTTIGAGRRSTPLRCANGHMTQVDGSELDRETRKVEDALDGLDRTIDDINRHFR